MGMGRLLDLLARLPWARQLREDASRAAQQNQTAEHELRQEESLAPERIRSAEAFTRRIAQNHLSELTDGFYDRGGAARWPI